MNGLPDLAVDPRSLRVVKRPIEVAVMFAQQDGVCDTLEGRVAFRAGDAVITGTRGEQWPVQRHVFLAAYAPVPPTEAGQDGKYHKLPSVSLALRLEGEMTVPVGWQADPLVGHEGDWVLRYEDGSHGVVSDTIFRESYRPAESGE